MGDLLQTAVDAGTNRIDSLSFFVADPSAASNKGLQQAYEDARRKAEKLASLSGSVLGRVLSISDGTPSNSQLVGKLRSLGYFGGGGISPGKEELTISVSVEFELKPAP